MKKMKFPMQATLLVTAVLLHLMVGHAATITKTRLVKGDPQLLSGTLFVTIDGRERAIAKHVWAWWVIAKGRAVVWAGPDGAGGYENEGQSLWRYDASSGKRRKLMAEQFMIEQVREARTRSGHMALVVTMSDGGLGAPHIAVVHPERGEVWRQVMARLDGIRNGRLIVSLLRSQDILDSGPEAIKRIRPIKTFYLNLDALLRRRLVKPPSGPE